ncbi:Nn.00g109410.m01.CDS01 [Neocucurbitaria sp. VM-36]
MGIDLEEEHTFNIEQVPTIWLLTALCVVPLAVYFLLSVLSPIIHRLTAMTISEIYVYPIKSLRGVKVTEAVATKYGFQYDRSFMLLEKTADGYKNMAVSRYPEMTQFLQEMDNGSLTVKYRAYGDGSKATSLKIPLVPDTEKLKPIEITMHSSPTSGFIMPEKYNAWFSECFGYEVVLVYIGENKRAVLFQNMQPLEPDPMTRFIKKNIPFAGSYVEKIMGLHQNEQWKIRFADCAPYLITSQTSLEEVSGRLPEGEEMDMTKFRPNIVIKGAFEPFQEDYWGRLKINNKAEIIMAHNCVRCKSINIDYETGKPGTGPSGDVLKKLQSDRRIDIGSKWNPVFGRYSFWDPKYPTQTVKVGDRVNVAKVNEGLTVWSWPNL